MTRAKITFFFRTAFAKTGCIFVTEWEKAFEKYEHEVKEIMFVFVRSLRNSEKQCNVARIKRSRKRKNVNQWRFIKYWRSLSAKCTRTQNFRNRTHRSSWSRMKRIREAWRPKFSVENDQMKYGNSSNSFYFFHSLIWKVWIRDQISFDLTNRDGTH